MNYSKEQCYAANEIPIVAILYSFGERTEKIGNTVIWDEHDSVRFSGSKWYRFSTGESGHSVDFCMTFYDMDYQAAVKYLLETFKPELIESVRDELGRTRKECNAFVPGAAHKDKAKIVRMIDQESIPRKNKTNDGIRNYLCEKRNISAEVVSFFIQNGSLYETAGKHHVAFIGRDCAGNPRSIQCRGTDDTNGKYRQNVKGSDLSYGFRHVGEDEKLYVFEAPIDMMSFISMYQKSWKKHNYLALNGLSKGALLRMLQEQPGIKQIILCLDNDKAGHEACTAIAKALHENGYGMVQRLLPDNKDWNEDLIERGGEKCNQSVCYY